MKGEIIKEILQEYDQIRLNEEKALRQREDNIQEMIPEIVNLRTEIVKLNAQRAQEVILNPDSGLGNTIKELQDKVEKLKDRERMLLLENGFPEDYLSPHYHCPLCKDTGYAGEPIKERCRCFIQKILSKTYRHSDIKLLEKENFLSFDPNVFPDTPMEDGKLTQRQYMVELKERLRTYAEEIPNHTRKTLLFTGKTGLGKTFLLNCIARAVMDKGHIVLQTTAYRLFDQLFRSNFNDPEQNRFLLDRLFEADILIIDDLGTETQLNNFTSETFFNILNERFLKDRFTFISTNLSLPILRERYSDRITSRLFDTTNTILIRFMGQDIRIRHRA